MADDHTRSRHMNTKRRRITQACDYCHKRSIRCRPSPNSQGCQNCKDFAQECTYHRKPRRRGTKPRGFTSTDYENHESEGEDSSSVAADTTPVIASSNPQPMHTVVPVNMDHWRAPHMASQANVMDLVELYFEIVYPIFPFFHQPTFIRQISRAEYMNNKSLFSVTMALCALVSGRVRDGSVTNPRWNLQPLQKLEPESFYTEAKKQLVDLAEQSDINILRGHAILAIAAIQNGRIRDMHQHLGAYHTLVAMDGLHDEANWPRHIGIVEREERRRLFWSIYTLDIYSSVVWGGIIRCRERQSFVAYPIELDDEMIDDNETTSQDLTTSETSQLVGSRGSRARSECWLSGWNFVTDLYRVLEHALTRFRGFRGRAATHSFLDEILDDDFTAAKSSARERVLRMYLDLPDCFKETPQMVYNAKKDRFGFQAANITATFQLLRIILFAASGSSIEERCQIASEVVEAFISIPISYLLSISTPLLHHLGGIGTILGNVLGEPLSEGDYTRVRAVMLSMAQLLENLEVIHRRTSASNYLRSQVSRIDDYMTRQRQVVPSPTILTSQGMTGQSITEIQEAEGYQQIIPDISLSWTFPEQGDLLGDLTWNFNLE